VIQAPGILKIPGAFGMETALEHRYSMTKNPVSLSLTNGRTCVLAKKPGFCTGVLGNLLRVNAQFPQARRQCLCPLLGCISLLLSRISLLLSRIPLLLHQLVLLF
jgi:hypothetical protein